MYAVTADVYARVGVAGKLTLDTGAMNDAPEGMAATVAAWLQLL